MIAYGKLTENVASFCSFLRSEYGFSIGMAEPQDALRAMSVIGIDNVDRVRSALRAICCTSRDQLAVFDLAFDAFFLQQKRRVRQGKALRREVPPRPNPKIKIEAGDAMERWEAMRARYSSIPAVSVPPKLRPADALTLAAAGRYVARVRRGRSRRWKPQPRGSRIDVRRTLRASLQSGGEPRVLRRLGHPLRNPRFVVLIDGSRSMSEYGSEALLLAYALRRRCARTRVFVFSTELREVTHALRSLQPRDLGDLGEAWGGGTRIGSSLRAFLCRYSVTLNDDTVVFVFSDGLEIGEARQLELGVRNLRRSGSALVWVNPLLALEEYTPLTRGMRAALPHLDEFVALRGCATFDMLGTRT
jgi:uncharacterized protein